LQEPHYFSTPRKEVSRGSFKNCGASSFAVPNKISDLKFINSPSSLNLEWNKPDHIYGILSHYTVELQVTEKHFDWSSLSEILQFLRYAACQNFSGTPFESEKLTTRESKIAITGLKPYCVYSFSVSASNTYFEGTPTTQLYTTPSSGNKTISCGQFNVKISRAHPRTRNSQNRRFGCECFFGSNQIYSKSL
jgi:hypothetical protein